MCCIQEDDPHRPLCCGITPKHIEAIIYWCVFSFIGTILTSCCCPKKIKEGKYSRKSSGRKDIKYSNYQPLKNNLQEDVSLDQEDVELGRMDRNNEGVTDDNISLADASYKRSWWSYFSR